MTLPKVGSIVVVDWLDANSYGAGWKHKEELDGQLLKCSTVGWLMRDDKKTISMAATASEDEFVTDACVIPKSFITKVTVLKRKKVK